MTGDANGDLDDPGGTRDPVVVNQATARRGAPPGRAQTGWAVTRRWFWITICVLIGATTVLVAALLSQV